MGLGDLFKKNKKKESEEVLKEETVEEIEKEDETESAEVGSEPEAEPINAQEFLGTQQISVDSQIMGIFQHKLVPSKLSDDPVYFITSIISDKGKYINNFFNGLYLQQKMRSPYVDEDFVVSKPYDVEGVKVVRIDMPEEHLINGLAKRVYIVYNERFLKTLYLLVEQSPDGDKMCAWIDGEHDEYEDEAKNEEEMIVEIIKDEEIKEEKYSDVIDKLMEQAKDYPKELLTDMEEIMKHSNVFRSALLQTQKFKQEDKRDEALKLIREVIKKEGIKYQNTDDIEFHSFQNAFEVLLYANLYHPYNPEKNEKKQLAGMRVDMASAYLVLGAMMLEKNQFDKAIEILWKAVEANPINVQMLFALADAYKGKRYLKSYLTIIKRAHVCAFRKVDIARIYRNYAYYYAQMKDFDTAAALCYASKYFDENIQVFKSYLKNIEKEAGVEFDEPSLDEIKKRLAINGIKWGAKELVVSVVKLLDGQFKAQNNEQGIKMCEQIKNELTLNA